MILIIIIIINNSNDDKKSLFCHVRAFSGFNLVFTNDLLNCPVPKKKPCEACCCLVKLVAAL